MSADKFYLIAAAVYTAVSIFGFIVGRIIDGEMKDDSHEEE